MALITTSKGRTARLVYTGDPSVELRPEALQRRLDTWRRRQLRAVLASLPKDMPADRRAEAEELARLNVEAETLPRVWAGLDECMRHEGATVATVRALSWHEDQEVQGLPADQNIRRVLEHCVLEIDGSADAAKAFLADPAAILVTPLYHAITDLTWGN